MFYFPAVGFEVVAVLAQMVDEFTLVFEHLIDGFGEIVEPFDGDGNDPVAVGVEDIAALVGVTPESVSRCLADMKREHLLVKSAAHRFVFDWDGLTEASTPDLET